MLKSLQGVGIEHETNHQMHLTDRTLNFRHRGTRTRSVQPSDESKRRDKGEGLTILTTKYHMAPINLTEEIATTLQSTTAI